MYWVLCPCIWSVTFQTGEIKWNCDEGSTLWSGLYSFPLHVHGDGIAHVPIIQQHTTTWYDWKCELWCCLVIYISHSCAYMCILVKSIRRIPHAIHPFVSLMCFHLPCCFCPSADHIDSNKPIASNFLHMYFLFFPTAHLNIQ